ncbi:hypothetical protein R1sor_003911 [Riccia sorocarpa]|uniref:Uncharacterized protein n=1 Tax=Riccia sorocarpa TaxID=122646 RepID=A0ABD3H5T5_9MARC
MFQSGAPPVAVPCGRQRLVEIPSGQTTWSGRRPMLSSGADPDMRDCEFPIGDEVPNFMSRNHVEECTQSQAQENPENEFEVGIDEDDCFTTVGEDFASKADGEEDVECSPKDPDKFFAELISRDRVISF